jgi:glycosyltransferase involved in cell wall biosynthesis
MMNIVVHNAHDDDGGGGYYSRPLIEALSRFGTVQNRDEWHLGMNGNPDLFVCINHTGIVPPIGNKNLRVCYCPLSVIKVNTDGYDGAISLGDWIDQQQALKWGLRSWVIYPSIDLDAFRPLPKRKLIINAGGYFYDKGHSKNQLAVIKWFGDERLWEQGWELVCMGAVHKSAEWYWNACSALGKATPNVMVYRNIPHGEQLYKLFGEAQFLVHANGLTGHYPDEVEHFGIVAIEALASGCQPVAHDSGGCRYIPGTRTWRTWDDIKRLMEVPFSQESLRERALRYSFDNMRTAVGDMLLELGL